MGNMTAASLNGYIQTYSGAKLRTFSKAINIAVTTYIGVYGTDNVNGAVMAAQNGPSNVIQRPFTFQYTAAADSLYNNYYDTAGISPGSIVYAQDIVDSIEDAVQRTVSLINSRVTYNTATVLCHSSCHNSCHTSRGRR